MCTIAAIRRDSQTILLKSFDYRPVATGWSLFEDFNGGHRQFSLVDHDQRGINSGLNEAGLALQISRSGKSGETPEREELRTVLNAEVLSTCSTVDEGVRKLESYAGDHPEMYGGNVILGDSEKISVTEYFEGSAKSEVVEDGVLVRANHSVFGLIDNRVDQSEERFEEMTAFADGLYGDLDEVDNEAAFDRCKERLRTPPIFRDTTRSSFVIDVVGRRIDHTVKTRPWRTFSFAEASEAVPV